MMFLADSGLQISDIIALNARAEPVRTALRSSEERVEAAEGRAVATEAQPQSAKEALEPTRQAHRK